MRRFLLLVLLFLVPAAAEAQKRCRKGIPCGGTCISASKTCRVGTYTPPPRDAVASTELAAPSGASSGSWVASARGHTYYRAGCPAGSKLAPANRVYFDTEEKAQAAGYRRSRSRGC